MIDQALSTGILAIDLQHDIILDLLQGYLRDIEHGSGVEQLPNFLRVLKGYTRHHFQVEEREFAHMSYSTALNHHHDHAAYLQQLDEWIDKLDHQQPLDPQQLITDIQTWIRQHIQQHDQLLSRQLLEDGIDIIANI